MSRGAQPDEPEWLAKPSGECCLKGHLHTGKPQGTFEWLAEIETYVSQPPAETANGHIILYYPDVFGFFNNGLLVCDEFAKAGYLTIGIDYFKGVSFPWALQVWIGFSPFRSPLSLVRKNSLG